MEKLVIIASTNRPSSLTKVVATYYYERFLTHKVQPYLLSLEDLPADALYSALYMNKGRNREVNKLVSLLDSHSKHLWVIPEYHGSIPGVLKTFIDALTPDDVIKGKKTGLVGVSAGYRGNLAGLSHFNDILRYLGAHVHPMQPTLVRLSPPKRSSLERHPQYIERIERHVMTMIQY